MFEARIGSPGSTARALSSFAFRSTISGTTSIASSTPASSSTDAAGRTRSRVAAASASVLRPRSTARASEDSIRASPDASASGLASQRSVSIPARAQSWAIPAPIVPAPSTPTRWTSAAPPNSPSAAVATSLTA